LGGGELADHWMRFMRTSKPAPHFVGRALPATIDSALIVGTRVTARGIARRSAHRPGTVGLLRPGARPALAMTLGTPRRDSIPLYANVNAGRSIARRRALPQAPAQPCEAASTPSRSRRSTASPEGRRNRRGTRARRARR
jgi:hypothetical protein